MKYQVGDKIIVLHSNEEGEIIDIINDKMVMIDVRGVRFPAYMDQIDFPYFRQFTDKKMFQPKKERKFADNLKIEKDSQAIKGGGVRITFLPVIDIDEFGDDVVKELKIHLVNGSDAGYNFKYTLNFFGKTDFELKNAIHAGEDFYLHDVPFENMNDNPSFSFEFTLLKPDKTKAPFFEYTLKLKAKQIFSRIEEIQKRNEATFSYPLFEQYPVKSAADFIDTGSPAGKGTKAYDAKEARQHLEPARSVVDLHIDKIIPAWKHLSNFEILTLQLNEFEKYYDLAVAHHLSSMILIHGLGEGKLRDEIHYILRMKKEVKSVDKQ